MPILKLPSSGKIVNTERIKMLETLPDERRYVARLDDGELIDLDMTDASFLYLDGKIPLKEGNAGLLSSGV